MLCDNAICIYGGMGQPSEILMYFEVPALLGLSYLPRSRQPEEIEGGF